MAPQVRELKKLTQHEMGAQGGGVSSWTLATVTGGYISSLQSQLGLDSATQRRIGTLVSLLGKASMQELCVRMNSLH